MPKDPGDTDQAVPPGETEEAADAAREAGRIGGRAGDEDLDPAQRPLVEAGGGVAEGFELAEEELVEAAQHGDSGADPLADAFTPERDGDQPSGEYGEADHEDSSEVPDSDR